VEDSKDLHNGMASEKQRKQDLCVLAITHEQCKTLDKLLPKASIHSSNRTYLKYTVLKILHSESPHFASQHMDLPAGTMRNFNLNP
jgi:hypothetical protein